MKNLLSLVFLICLCFQVMAQTRNVSGTVNDASGSPVTGATVVAKGTTIGTVTDVSGNFSLAVPESAKSLSISFIGYASQDVAIPASGAVAVTLAESASELDAVVISVGSRNTQRTVTDNPLPIDIFGAKDLQATGQTSFDKALQYRVPSFNTVNTPVNDATTLLDPYEIRNMGPSRTLILVNGKRKNLSSLLYVQFSPGRGETGVDLSAIPTDAIKRVEILRDGASAQYGSDAIAGVMNVILKDRYEYTSLNLNSGITAKGDGASYGLTLNSGGNFGSKGYVNYTIGVNQNDNAVRSGKIDIPTEIATFGGSPAQDALIKAYLNDYPTGGNLNGTGENSSVKFVANAGIPIGENNEIYANAAVISKRVLSNANFRTPYWRQDRGLLHNTGDNKGKNYITKETLAFSTDNPDIYKGYIGYMPTFEGDLVDYTGTVGAKGETDGWKHDISLTTGGNSQAYTVDNTVNRGLGTASPTRFKPGGYGFKHLVGNMDISKAITDQFSIAFGTEARSETFTIMAGDSASYVAEGSNSFPGISAVNAGSNSRFNIGAYVDLSYDVTKDFLINAAVRTEKYSDFGAANVWKLSSRYKAMEDKIVVRGSVSTGFRAPTLHQIYAQSVQAAFVGGNISLSGLFNNKSVQARLLGIPALKPEKSTNYSVGVGFNPMKNLSISLDYYLINVKDRIVYSSSISTSDKASALGQILQKAGVRTVQFFINGIETNTSGLDYVVAYRNIALGAGKLGVNLAGNFVLSNEIVGTPNEPAAIKAANASILNSQIKSLLTQSRPQYKSILGFDYQVDKYFFNLNNTLFGPTSFQDLDNGGGDMENIKAVFTPAVVTDLSIGYAFSDKISLTLNANNLLNVLPKWDLVALNDKGAKVLSKAEDKSLLRGFLGFSGRYDILGYNGSQFSQLGTMFNANLSVKF